MHPSSTAGVPQPLAVSDALIARLDTTRTPHAPTAIAAHCLPSPTLTESSLCVRTEGLEDNATATPTSGLSGCESKTAPRTRVQHQDGPRFERQLGNSEVSYFLPSRADGVNDMYLHLGFRTPRSLATTDRVRAVWAVLRIRHPLLAARVEMANYDDIRFAYTVPRTPDAALEDAALSFEFRRQDKDQLISSYLNGPRTLSASCLSYLILSDPHGNEPLSPPESPIQFDSATAAFDGTHQYEILICAAHFIGDGMALHNFANEFFALLSTKNTTEELIQMHRDAWRVAFNNNQLSPIPPAAEELIPLVHGNFERLIAKVDFQIYQSKFIGEHTFPKTRNSRRHTVVPTLSFDEVTTKKALQKCKAQGVSISNALFAICNVVWARMANKPQMPMMMYSALNLRPYLTHRTSDAQARAACDSYWFLAVGYFNIILPTLIPSTIDQSATFWMRARSAKIQGTRAVKSPMVTSRVYETAEERAVRARVWAKEDDDNERGVSAPSAPPPLASGGPGMAAWKAPSTALMGLSLLGNLDGIYKHSAFPDVKLHMLTTGSRQRPGGMLLFGYTFVGKLWISLGYDELGFQQGVVEEFWAGVVNAVDEFLV